MTLEHLEKVVWELLMIVKKEVSGKDTQTNGKINNLIRQFKKE